MDGIWLYPVFEVMTWNQRIIFSLAVFGLLHLFNICGEKLTYQIWGKIIFTLHLLRKLPVLNCKPFLQGKVLIS